MYRTVRPLYREGRLAPKQSSVLPSACLWYSQLLLPIEGINLANYLRLNDRTKIIYPYNHTFLLSSSCRHSATRMFAAILAWLVFLVCINASIKAVNLFKNLANDHLV
jgi:hypothetical protein